MSQCFSREQGGSVSCAFASPLPLFFFCPSAFSQRRKKKNEKGKNKGGGKKRSMMFQCSSLWTSLVYRRGSDDSAETAAYAGCSISFFFFYVCMHIRERNTCWTRSIFFLFVELIAVDGLFGPPKRVSSQFFFLFALRAPKAGFFFFVNRSIPQLLLFHKLCRLRGFST